MSKSLRKEYKLRISLSPEKNTRNWKEDFNRLTIKVLSGLLTGE
ncbi:14315_t:CDS:1, partial [Ambispora leptoticha]